MKKEELITVLLTAALMAGIISFNNSKFNLESILPAFTISLIIIFACTLSKKAIANYLDIEIKVKIIPFQRWGITTSAYFKRPLPGGLIFPLLFLIISQGAIKVFAFLSFDTKALPAKAAKKYGQRRYSRMIMEWDDGLIAFWSLVAIMILSIISKILFSYINITEIILLSRYSLYFALWNLIPIGQMDGSKIFYSSRPLYIFSLILAAITFLIIFF